MHKEQISSKRNQQNNSDNSEIVFIKLNVVLLKKLKHLKKTIKKNHVICVTKKIISQKIVNRRI